MITSSKLPLSVAIVTDDPAHAASLLPEISIVVSAELFVWNKLRDKDLTNIDILIFDVDISIVANIRRLREIQSRIEKRQETVFPVDKSNHKAVSQSNALGAKHIVKRPLEAAQLVTKLAEICKTEHPDMSFELEPIKPARVAVAACLEVSDLLDGLEIAVRSGRALPVEQLYEGSSKVVGAIESTDMDTWLTTVRSHSSYTYRHIMIVTGFAAAFGVTFNMSRSDTERLTLGALVHDIGKVKIPQKILDKPGKLTETELKKMRSHPSEGASILRKDGRLSDEIVSIARHHHEYLDGSGYPDKLVGDEIPDIVRIMTVVDIFSALVEARSYKKSMSSKDAYGILLEMGDKLDQDIVRAFEPIAFDKESHRLVQRVNASAA